MLDKYTELKLHTETAHGMMGDWNVKLSVKGNIDLSEAVAALLDQMEPSVAAEAVKTWAEKSETVSAAGSLSGTVARMGYKETYSEKDGLQYEFRGPERLIDIIIMFRRAQPRYQIS